jgi:hypothetical protein
MTVALSALQPQCRWLAARTGRRLIAMDHAPRPPIDGGIMEKGKARAFAAGASVLRRLCCHLFD